MNKRKLKNSPPHLTVVSSYFYPKMGGLETIAYTVAKSLHEKGEYKVSVITTNYDGTGYRKEIIDGMTVHRLPISFRVSNTPINLRWSRWVRKILQEEETDILQTHSPVPFLVDVSAKVAKAHGIPIVVTYHSGSMKKGQFILDAIIGVYESYFLGKLFSRASAIVAVAQNFVQQEFPQFLSKTFFIPTGVDVARFKKTPVPADTEIVAFVGRIELSSKWKGIDYLIKAMAIVIKHRPHAKLQLIGGGDAVEYYRKQAKELNIENSLLTPGPQYNNDLVDAYGKTTMVVLPSISDSEAFSVALVEAMASGRPIIGTKIGGTPQVINDEKDGLLVPAKNPEALALAIERILSNHGFAQQLGDAGALKAQGFTWDIQISKYKDIYKNLLL
jgi:glycosyltransferase involved in cell wall biosynthesis